MTDEEYLQDMQEMVDNIRDVMEVVNRLKDVINTQSEVIGCHRYLLTSFIPGPHLEATVKQYVKLRGSELNAEVRRALNEITGTNASSQVN